MGSACRDASCALDVIQVLFSQREEVFFDVGATPIQKKFVSKIEEQGPWESRKWVCVFVVVLLLTSGCLVLFVAEFGIMSRKA